MISRQEHGTKGIYTLTRGACTAQNLGTPIWQMQAEARVPSSLPAKVTQQMHHKCASLLLHMAIACL